MEESLNTNYFTDLYRVDVSSHVEKKNGFSYVSWPFAVAELRKRHPDATWEVVRFNGLPYLETPTGHFVEVAVTVKGVRLAQIHPVLDHANRPIKQPTSFHINTSIQRALVKAIALHGLGLFVYAGEDLPEGAETKVERLDGISEMRISELEQLAVDMLEWFQNGQELKASEAYYSLPDNEEKLVVWGLLKGPGGGSTPESRLRSFIKANSPHQQKEAA